MSRRILVTGGAGFVGSNVVDALVANGDEVVVVDDLATGSRDNLDARVPLHVTDISNTAALTEALAGERFDAVVHCASKTKVVESFEKPDLYRRVIVDGTRNVLDLARSSGATSFINVSSGGVMYGETPKCASEAREPEPSSPYGECKAAAEAIVAEAKDIRAITLRPANIYGPRQRTDLEGGVVAIFQARWRRGEPLIVFGDGTAERDYVYVGDVADAILASLSSTLTGIYNVGTGVATSVNGLIHAMVEVLGPPVGVQYAPARPGELARSCLDSSKAARDRLWWPRTPLADGLRSTAKTA